MEGTGAELAISQAIRSRILLNSPTPNIAWDYYGAATYTPPTVNTTTPANSLWIRPSHMYKADPAAWGGGSHWAVGRGIISVQVFGPYGLSAVADELVEQTAGQVANVFRYQRFDGIHCQSVTPDYALDAEGNWHQISLSVPFLCNLRTEGLAMSEINGRMNFSQASHGFSGTLALALSSGSWIKASAATSVRAQSILIAVQGDSFQVATHGLQGFTHGLGASGDIWLGTNGAITTTEPVSGFRQRLGTIKNANLLLVSIEPGATV